MSTGHGVNVSYKQYHEDYLSNHSGGGLLDVPMVLSTIVLLGFNSIYLRCHVSYKNHFFCYMIDFFDIILPCIIFLTVLSDYLVLCFTGSLILFLMTVVRGIFFKKYPMQLSEALNKRVSLKRRPFVTNFKSIISLLTVLCILAVDFTIFPRKFIKTEAYGYSLMDTGVGFFVVANALTCNLKESNGLNRKAITNNLPILVLGVIRYVSTETINYQKHVTEYGVHWNFFFTLAIVKSLGPYLASKFTLKWYMLVMWFAMHQLFLKIGLEAWVMKEGLRTDLLSANREGIVSILGYLCLYVLGVHIGCWLLYASPKPFVKDEMKKGLLCLLWFLILTTFLKVCDCHSSRRLANPTFVIWMISLCLLVLGVSILWESLIGIFCRRMMCGAHHDSTLFILEAISANNLLFFLIGNLLTGAVNLSINTLYVSPTISLLIIVLYVAASTGIICVLYSKKINLKYW